MARDPRGASEPAPPPREERTWTISSRRLKQVFGGVAAAVGLLVGVAALVDWIGGRIDDPGGSASFTAAELQLPNDRLRDFVIHTNQPLSNYSPEELREVGMRFRVGVQIQGMKGQELLLAWRMHTAEGRPLSNDAFDQDQSYAIEAKNDNQSRTFPVWVPTPFRSGDYIIRFTLIDSDGEPVAESQAVPFTYEA